MLVFVQLREDSAKLHAALRCMLGHEFGHIRQRDKSTSERIASQICCKINNMQYFHPWTYKIVGLFLNPIKNIFEVFCTRQEEIAADRFAGQNLQEAAIGAQYGFNAAIKATEALKKCNALSWKERMQIRLIMPFNQGPLPQLFTHGSYSGRARFISKVNARSFPTSA